MKKRMVAAGFGLALVLLLATGLGFAEGKKEDQAAAASDFRGVIVAGETVI